MAKDPSGKPAFALGDEFARALEFALEVHADQPRKGTRVPYVSHLLAVAGSVLDAGGDQNQAIAGLLHDSAEDGAGEATLLEIERLFGEDVASLVRDCSDALPQPGQKKAPWLQRKAEHIAHLAGAQRRVLVVVGSDKLHNARAIDTDLRIHGLAALGRFKGGAEGTVWYLRSMHGVLVHRKTPKVLTEPLGLAIDGVEQQIRELSGT